MKNTLFSLIVMLAVHLTGQSQACLPNGITFSTQASIDNFHLNYPGCKIIGGDVNISGTDITNLNGLMVLDSIRGALRIDLNPLLPSCAGLENLKSTRSIRIANNPALTNLAGLNGIHTLDEYLYIFQNATLPNLNGLENIQSVGSEIYIVGNPAMGNLNGLEHLTSAGSFTISNNALLSSLSGLENLTTINGAFNLWTTPNLPDLSGLEQLQTVGGDFVIDGIDSLKSLNGLEQLSIIGGSLSIRGNLTLANLDKLAKVLSIGGDLLVSVNPALPNLGGLENISSVGGALKITYNTTLNSLEALKNIANLGGDCIIEQNYALPNLNGLGKFSSVGGYLRIAVNHSLTSLSGIEQVTSVANSLEILGNNALSSLHGLENLTAVGGLTIQSNAILANLYGLQMSSVQGSVSIGNHIMADMSGLEHLTSVLGNLEVSVITSYKGLDSLIFVGGNVNIWYENVPDLKGLGRLKTVGNIFSIHQNPGLKSLNGLESLQSVGYLAIYGNPLLTDLNGLNQLSVIKETLEISNNTQLSDCAILAVCNHLLNKPGSISNIHFNAPGCNNTAEVEALCNSIPVITEVFLDENGNCQPDVTDIPAVGIQVQLSGQNQMTLRPTDSDGMARFKYLEKGIVSLSLPQFPSSNWAACQDTFLINPDTIPDTIRTTFLLSPLLQCPELKVELGLPGTFRGCLVSSQMEVSVQNMGTISASGVELAVVMPPVLELLSAVPAQSAQSGDTLFFGLGNISPLHTATVQMTVKTRCDTFVAGQTLCLEAFARLNNACPTTLPAFSEIKLSAHCLGDTMVRFTLKNVGDAPTQAPHDYILIRNENVMSASTFHLDAQKTMTLDVPADGSTYRLEATKFEDGTRTAVALENCGGLTPGLITAFWLDEGSLDYDFDCRLVTGAFDPNQKSAVPTGAGPEHLIEANYPLQYTIEFQNTGTDTAFRVLLTDDLPPQLDISTFQPGFASHPYTWTINDSHLLEVLFSPIALPDSVINEPASHGFFSFQINQKPGLSDGTTFDNTASIIFDFNPPITTNTVTHNIGKLIVEVDEAQPNQNLWLVNGNPTRFVAVFRSQKYISGDKRIDLFDTAGRQVRTAQFSGQEFELRRKMLPAGLYFFRINDAQNRVFTGKIIWAD